MLMARKNIHDVPQKTRIKLPDPVKPTQESHIAIRLEKYRKVFKDYNADITDGKVKNTSNLSKK